VFVFFANYEGFMVVVGIHTEAFVLAAGVVKCRQAVLEGVSVLFMVLMSILIPSLQGSLEAMVFCRF
jgi:hypothetical protein